MQDKLTDLEIAKIEAFCNDSEMNSAVKKVLFALIYSSGLVKKGEDISAVNGAFNLIAISSAQEQKVSNEELGADLRAKYEAVNLLLNGFAHLNTIKKQVESPYAEENKAI